MCGIAAIFVGEPGLAGLGARVTAMTASLVHRGPDSFGIWVHDGASAALGHRRLAIQDLSPLGHQPMRSRSGRYTLAFNGEIYNFRSLRVDLARLGHVFDGHSDTEVLLGAFEQWGVERALQEIAGMFAFAVWDEEHRSLVLARDRMGEKPLYVARARGSVLVASELRAFLAVPEFSTEIQPAAIASLLKLGYIPGPLTIYRDAYKLSPASLLELRSPGDLDEAVHRGGRQLLGVSPALGTRYWQLERLALDHVPQPKSRREAADIVDETLRSIVREQLVADVPVGAFLSGGVDSSTVVAAIQAASGQPVRTFTIAFPGTEFDESQHAEAVARHLGTQHTTIDVAPEDLLDIAPSLGALYDEPFADSSQIATVLVARAARRHVTVCLAGDGGDELFSGYSRYGWMASAAASAAAVPRPLRSCAALAIRAFARHAPPYALQALLAASGSSGLNSRERFHKLADVLVQDDARDVYEQLISYWAKPSAAMSGYADDLPEMALLGATQRAAGPWIGSMLWDQLVYLPGDNLTKVDRASMSVSLEVRLPLLDHRMVEAVWGTGLRQSPEILGKRKALLKEVLYRYVPPELIERPKMGFTVPLAEWLRGPLRGWASDLLAGSSGQAGDYIDRRRVAGVWEQHQRGDRDNHMMLWPVLMLLAWEHAHLSSTRSTSERRLRA